MSGKIAALYALVVLLGATAPRLLAAQRPERMFGAQVGLNLADVGGPGADGGGTEARVGFLAGLFGSIPVGENLAIQPELLYTQKGFKITDNGATANLKLSYVQVPVFGKISFPSESTTPFLVAGPSLGLKVGCRVSARSQGVSVGIDCQNDTESVISASSTDFSLVVGGGVELGDAIVSARYDHGISNIDSAAGAPSTSNRTLTISVGYGFRIAGR
jgi:hypothetical protein